MSSVASAVDPEHMTTVDHGHRHVWTGTTARTVRCAVMFCQAKPSPADIERLRVEAEEACRLRHEITYRH